MAEDPIKLFSTRAERYPQPTEADAAVGAGRAALAAIPFVGGSITEVLSLVLAPAVTRRRDTWFKELADGLEEAERKIEGFSVENLVQDEVFVSAVIQATREAVSTHQTGKREALRNALLNIAVGRAPDEDMQQIFFSYLESLTGSHIRLLAAFRNPKASLEAMEKPLSVSRGAPNFYMSSPADVLERILPEFEGRREIYDQAVRDLYSRGLFSIDSLHSMVTAQGSIAKRTTDRGDAFLDFIADPLA